MINLMVIVLLAANVNQVTDPDFQVYTDFLKAAERSVTWLQQAFESGNTQNNKNDTCYLRKFELATAYAYIGIPEGRDLVRKVSDNGIITYHILISTEYVDGKRSSPIDLAYVYEKGNLIAFRVDRLPKDWMLITSPDQPKLFTLSKQGEKCMPYMLNSTDPFFLLMPILIET